MPQKNVEIYALADPRDGRVRYVGRAVSARKRLSQHCSQAMRGVDKTNKGRWLRAMMAVGIRPRMRVLDVVPASEWQRHERRWIKRLRSRGLSLLNLSNGGDGCEGYKHTKEAVERFTASMKGKTKSPEHRARLSLSKKGIPMSDEARRKMSQSGKGRVKSPSHIEKVAAAHRGRVRPETTRAKLRARWQQRTCGNNAAGARGVSKSRGRWQASIKVNGKSLYLGRFDSVKEAADAYNAKFIEIHGESCEYARRIDTARHQREAV